MADINSRATVDLVVNGKNAEESLKKLKKEAEKLQNKLTDCKLSNDKETREAAKNIERQLKRTTEKVKKLEQKNVDVINTLKNIDKASLSNLQKSLRQLEAGLKNIERGSQQWKLQTEAIRRVKAEINSVNSALRVTKAESQGFFDRVNGFWNKFQVSVMAAAGALTGVIMAGRKAVKAYAEMEQEMANVRKYTGMDADQVNELNEEFKKIDTRSSREELNRLAQEAGRLGKSSVEDVLGFVKAADKINVALDDLGDDATLQLSKLTGIFGDEKRLGTEKALLSVGSVINELSQNCSASAPYIAEFASRMGGVGAQAGLTVQQIMAFAAVLDTNNQKLEASSTALSQVIVRIYQDPAKYAKVAGMNVSKFCNLVKTDMNAALIQFLSTLKQAGNMDVLSPMFKDMGENGSRAISALSTLANHIDDVKWQQREANKAFAEAISIDQEFNVQNNTVQAGMDKAKKRLNEIAVELGEKLSPIMKHIYSTSSLLLRFVSESVTFIINYKREIITLIASIAAYVVVTKGAAVATKAWALATSLGTGVVKAAKTAILALRIGYYSLTQNITKAEAATKLFNRTSKASPWGIIVALATAAAGAVYSFTKRLLESKNEMQKIREMYAKIESEANEASSVQIKMLDELYKRTQDQTLAQDERIQAIQRLRNIYPDYFADISNEAFLAGKAAAAYNKLKNAILESARAKGREGVIAKIEEQIQNRQDEYDAQREKWILEKQKALAKKMSDPSYKLENDPAYRLAEWNLNILEKKYEPEIEGLKKRQDNLASQNVDYEINKPNNENNQESEFSGPGSGSSSGGKSSSAAKDKFKAEKDWKEKEEALLRIAYATGKKNYLEYTAGMDNIAVEFYKRQLKHTDLSENERLSIEAQWREAEKKKNDDMISATIEAENNSYNERMANLKQFYIDGSLSKEAYDIAVEEAEILHQRNLIKLTKEGTKERAEADKQLQTLLIRQMEDRMRKTEKLEQEYAKFKSEYFGDNPQEAKAKYDKDLEYLDIVYQRELEAAGNNAAEKLRIDEAYEKAKIALQKKYGLISEDESKNSMQRAVEKSVEWLNSDGGKAVSQAADVLISGMSSIFSQLSSLVQAEMELETAKLEKRYNAEASLAEGNAYKVKQAEKKKEQEIAKVKKEANRKMFAMQVIQAVAQTAQNALNAYGSAAAVPVVGYILAPIAAAMAVAAGAVQIASIKKQQQASEATGYMEGGFTPSGPKTKEVGVVHAGEWVAPKEMVNNPNVRPIINYLEYARRNNRVASISPAMATYASSGGSAIRNSGQPVVVEMQQNGTDNGELVAAVRRLNSRLDDPFVTVNTVAGDHGVKKAFDDYDRLMRNKSYKR